VASARRGLTKTGLFKYEGGSSGEHEGADERASGMEPKVNSKIHRPIGSSGLYLGRLCLVPRHGFPQTLPTPARLDGDEQRCTTCTRNATYAADNISPRKWEA
jgi:hypothetical protein